MAKHSFIFVFDIEMSDHEDMHMARLIASDDEHSDQILKEYLVMRLTGNSTAFEKCNARPGVMLTGIAYDPVPELEEVAEKILNRAQKQCCPIHNSN